MIIMIIMITRRMQGIVGRALSKQYAKDYNCTCAVRTHARVPLRTCRGVEVGVAFSKKESCCLLTVPHPSVEMTKAALYIIHTGMTS